VLFRRKYITEVKYLKIIPYPLNNKGGVQAYIIPFEILNNSALDLSTP